MADFPVIDFSIYESNPKLLAHELFDAANKWGFLILTGHGIPQSQIDEMFSLSSSFFTQPAEVKEEKWMNTSQVGYDFKKSVIGVQEGMCFGDVAGSNITASNLSSWWDTPKRQIVENFRERCHDLSTQLLTLFATAMSLPPDFFSTAHSPEKLPGNVLRLIRYPALEEQPDPSFPRLGDHTDWGTLTLLFAKTAGLEVRSPNFNGWVAAPVVEGAVIVNIADGLALWSDRVLKSTLHRLSWHSLPFDKDRYSMAYFVNANADAPLKFLKQDHASGTFRPAEKSFDATFGDYQAVRMRIIHEKFDSDERGEGPVLDSRFVEMVKNMGVAHGHAVTFDGAGVAEGLVTT